MLDYKLESYNRDVYHSVTRDDKKVYIKLVNAEDFEKKLKINLDKLPVKKMAELVTLTGGADLVHMPNVNIKEAEKIVPVTGQLEVQAEGFEIMLPANSVNVVILENE